MTRSLSDDVGCDTEGGLYSIGHSNRAISEFISLLQQNGIQLLADVRGIPKSRNNPQFGQDVFPASLADSNIEYVWVEKLGGRPLKAKVDAARAEFNIPSGAVINGFWQVTGFRRYADYAMGSPFHMGLLELMELGREKRVAFMCSEAIPWRCHRRIISDYLVVYGSPPLEIISGATPKPHPLTSAAVVHQTPWRYLTYPASEI